MSEVTFTNPAKIDYIMNYMQKDKDYFTILNNIPNSAQKLYFDPMAEQTIMGWFIDAPDDFAALVKTAILQYLCTIRSKDVVEHVQKHFQVIISNAKQIKMHEWGPEHEGIPVSVNAMIVSQNKPETYTKSATLECEQGHVLDVRSLVDDIKCPKCENQMRIRLGSVKTGYIRSVLLQEPIDEAKHGRITMFDAIIKDDDVRSTYIGQRVNIIGVFRSIPQKYKSTNRIIISVLSSHSLENIQEIQPTEDQIKFFHQLKQQKDYVKTLAESIAPQIKHETLAKICILLALIGSPDRELQRDMLHTFILGNPSTGKSDMLEYVLLLIIKSALAVGGTMSGSGVTVTMDTLPNRQKMPRAGIVPLCNKGVVCLDELNQIDEEDIGKLYEAMESGTIHYNKGGFDLELEAKTTIIAGANPRYYVYNKDHNVVDNIDLPAPMLSRFDLIINLLGEKSSIERQEIIDHINLIDRIGVTSYITKANLLQPSELAAFISYAKTFEPVFTAESDKMVKDFQLSMESIKQKGGAIPIDKRFFYAIKRISKAIARIYFSKDVLPQHVSMAIEIKKKTLSTFGMNVEQGEISLAPSEVSTKDAALRAVCRDLEQKNEDGRFNEEEAIKSMYTQYPNYFDSIDYAAVFFAKANHMMTKVNGRFKLD